MDNSDIETKDETVERAPIEQLGSLINADKIRDPFNNGDVIRFKANLSSRDYTFAVLRAGGRWYSTGGGTYVPQGPISYKRLVEILNRDEVYDVEAASMWVKPQ